MSLVGNLADLGLGEILQIISLSQKSGTLQLATASDTGAIGFVQGKVVFALRDQNALTVADMLLSNKLASASQVQEMMNLQSQKPHAAQSQPPVLWETFQLSIDAVETALRSQIEKLVYEMFNWEEGNFSFVVADDPKTLSRVQLTTNTFSVMRGLNPQFLAMEGARLRDEASRNDPFKTFMARGEKAAAAAMQPEAPVVEDKTPVVELEAEPEQKPQPLPPVVVKPVVIAPQTPAVTAAFATLEIVLIDDDPNLLRLLREKLLATLPIVNVFTKVEAGLKRTRELLWANKKVVVVSDLILPRSDGAGILGGLEVLEKIRPDYPQVAVFLLTDFPNEEANQKAKQLNVNALVQKPRRAELEKDKTKAALDTTAAALVKEIASYVETAPALPDTAVPRPDEEPPQNTERIAPIERSAPLPPPPVETKEPEEPEEPVEHTARIEPITRSAPPEVERYPLDEPLAALDATPELPAVPVEPLPPPPPIITPPTPTVRAAAVITPPPLLMSPLPPPVIAPPPPPEPPIITPAPPDTARAGITPTVTPSPPEGEEVFDISFDDDEPPPSASASPIPVKERDPNIVSAVAANADPMGLADLSREIGLELSLPSPGEQEVDRPMVVLKSLLFELMSPASRDTIMLLVLRYAAELFSRSVLLLVARDELWGLGGYSHQVKNIDFIALVRKLRVRLDPNANIANVVKTKASMRAPFEGSEQERELAQKLGIDPKQPVFIAPLISADRVAAILLGDNQQMGKDLGDTHGLEIFLLQAGMAMERALLERRLREIARGKTSGPTEGA